MIYPKEQICMALLVELHSGLQVPVSQSQKCNIFYYFQLRTLIYVLCSHYLHSDNW